MLPGEESAPNNVLEPAPTPGPTPMPVAIPPKEHSLPKAPSGHLNKQPALTQGAGVPLTSPPPPPPPPRKAKPKTAPRPKPKRSRYRRKYGLLKKHIKTLILMNVAYCDQIAETQDKILISMGKRRFLTKKLLQHQAISETNTQLQTGDLNAADHLLSPATVNLPAKKVSLKKKSAGVSEKPSVPKLHKERSKVLKDYSKVKPLKDNTKVIKGVRVILKPKKGRMMKTKPMFQGISMTLPKKLVQAIPLDAIGRPIIPIILGDLVIDSLGDIVHDRPAYHTNDTIYPVGFRSTRVYGSTRYAGTRCIYSCKISDGGAYPIFEISIDGEMNSPLVGESPDNCHQTLIHQIKQNFGINLVKNNVGRGAEFFGLKHPVVLNALQGLPACKRCLKYRSSRFEVSYTAEEPTEEHDPILNYKALQKLIDKPLYRVGLKIEDDGY